MVEPSSLGLGILASGSGTNFEAIANAIELRRIHAAIRVVICNRPSATVMAKARHRGIQTLEMDHRAFGSRDEFDAAMAVELRSRGVELVVMAGFDRLVTASLLSEFPNRVINIHPGLLPAFKGLDAQGQAVRYGVRIAGATVHLVDEHMDHGPIVAQVAIPVASDETEASLRSRILEQEHVLYPQAIQLFADGRIEVRGRTVHILDGPANSPDDALFSPAQRTSR